jgi:hypothetical protein
LIWSLCRRADSKGSGLGDEIVRENGYIRSLPDEEILGRKPYIPIRTPDRFFVTTRMRSR